MCLPPTSKEANTPPCQPNRRRICISPCCNIRRAPTYLGKFALFRLFRLPHYRLPISGLQLPIQRAV